MGQKKNTATKQKHRTKIAILASNEIQAQCLCSWTGNVLAGKTSLNKTIEAASQEADKHMKGSVK